MNFKLHILSLCAAMMFASCSPEESKLLSKNELSEYKVSDQKHINWSDCLKQKEEKYLVFFYSETCAHCHEIMGDVLDFCDAKIVEVYFVDTRNQDEKVPISNDVSYTIGLTEIDNFSILGTPAFLEVNYGTIVNNVAGEEKCLSLLNELRIAI